MSTRRVHENPSFQAVETAKEQEKLETEIRKLKPKAEVSLEGLNELSLGKVIDWNEKRKLFTVRFSKKTESFDQKTDSKIGLRAFFKIQLFSTQLIFKTTTVRVLENGDFQYRIPEQVYKQQRRGALRVPTKSARARLKTAQGIFTILDLSVGGAKLKEVLSDQQGGLSSCVLEIDGRKISVPGLEARISHRADDFTGVRFVGANQFFQIELKQVLIDLLRVYYKEEL